MLIDFYNSTLITHNASMKILWGLQSLMVYLDPHISSKLTFILASLNAQQALVHVSYLDFVRQQK